MPLGPRRQAVDGERKEKLSSEELIRDLAAEAKQPPHAGDETEDLVPAAAEKLAIPVFAESVTRSLFPHLHLTAILRNRQHLATLRLRRRRAVFLFYGEA